MVGKIGLLSTMRLIMSPPKPVYQAYAKPYVKGKSGALFRNAHLRAKPLPKLKRCKKTGYIIHGTRSK